MLNWSKYFTFVHHKTYNLKEKGKQRVQGCILFYGITRENVDNLKKLRSSKIVYRTNQIIEPDFFTGQQFYKFMLGLYS